MLCGVERERILNIRNTKNKQTEIEVWKRESLAFEAQGEPSSSKREEGGKKETKRIRQETTLIFPPIHETHTTFFADKTKTWFVC